MRETDWIEQMALINLDPAPIESAFAIAPWRKW
jgi:hypothetical protein